ncbi:MAG TPA: tetratricopeptide repeat protein [Terriglobales bacterium]|nr:tetratricopeptide repeat protein [Terriglobales bacterium]
MKIMPRREPTSASRQAPWTSTQAYLLAVFCLLLGVALGYLFRASASPDAMYGPASPVDRERQSAQPQLSPEEQKQMVDQAVAPLLATLKSKPDDFATIVNVADLYYDGRQFPEAIQYYRRAVRIQPHNPDVLTDLGTSLWYTGDADQAIANFEQALKYRPDSPEALFNLGVVRWQGKMDPKGATQAWEELLERNPNYPQRQQIEEYIARAKQHAKG